MKKICIFGLLSFMFVSCDWETYNPDGYRVNVEPSNEGGANEKIPYTYYLEVSRPESVPFGGCSDSLVIQSYKKSNKGNIVKVPWEVVNSENLPSWLLLGKKDEVDSQGMFRMSYSVCAQSAAVAKVDDYDLSTNGGRTARSTANCYMIHSPGSYKLPLVYGNAIKDGVDNIESYKPIGTNCDTFLTPFKNHADADIVTPWMKDNGVTPDNAHLVWEDGKSLVTDISINGDYLCFNVPDDAIEGNAVLAATMDGTVVWSWHIWITNSGMEETALIKIGSDSYKVASMNLGYATNGRSLNNVSGRECTITIRQLEDKGKQLVITVRQVGRSLSSSEGYKFCTFYQWGRKDPFIPAAESESGRVSRDAFTMDGSNTTIMYATPKGIGWTIKNPGVCVINQTSRGPYGPYGNTQHNFWNTKTKTIYDPCPPGYRIMPYHVFAYMKAHGTMERNEEGKGLTWREGSNIVVFPATGFRESSTAAVWQAGQNGWYWSADMENDGYAKAVASSYVNVNVININESLVHKASGLAVRPIVE